MYVGKYKDNDYDYYKNKYIEISIQNDQPISNKCLSKYHLPYWRWFVDHCPNKNIKNWGQFVDWCGFFHPRGTTIDKAIELIYNMQDKIDGPLHYSDFCKYDCYSVHISYIRKHWGSLTNMKNDLELEKCKRGDPDRILTKQKLDTIINYIEKQCREKYDGNASYNIIYDLGDLGASQESIVKNCKKMYNKTLLKILEERGLNITVAGGGLVYSFDDGEKTLSQFEYLFSKLLRKNGFIYNVNYKRDVLYSSFVKCENRYTCDYVIFYKERTIYIEIPGIISQYKSYYYKNKPIETRKSEDLYRITLRKKEELLKSNNLEYYLLFPSDLTQENFSSILNEEDNIKEKIESEHRDNIKWKDVLKIGELIYTDELNQYKHRKILYHDEQKEAI